MLITTPSLCRTCFWRRNEIALRIASSIYTSNCASASTAMAPTLRCSLASLLARFAAKWNSTAENKTRFFNILGDVDDGGITFLLQSRHSEAVPEYGQAWSRTRDNAGSRADRAIRRGSGRRR